MWLENGNERKSDDDEILKHYNCVSTDNVLLRRHITAEFSIH